MIKRICEYLESRKAGLHNRPELKSLIGFIYRYPRSLDFIDENGTAKTLEGTDNFLWIAYWPKGDFTTIINKKTDRIEKIFDGKPGQFGPIK